jgi:hypothetical protein
VCSRTIRTAILAGAVLVGAPRVDAQTGTHAPTSANDALFSIDLSDRTAFSSSPPADTSDRPAAGRTSLVASVEDGRLRVPTLKRHIESDPAPRAPASGGRIGPKPRIADEHLGRIVGEACAFYGVDARLVACLIHQESGFSRFAVSPKGASGYMQLMPATAKRMGVLDVFDAKQNIWGGVRYLRYLLTLFDDDVELALAGYNAGEGRVIRAGYRVPAIAETLNYVRAIAARYGRKRHAVPIADHPTKAGQGTTEE